MRFTNFINGGDRQIVKRLDLSKFSRGSLNSVWLHIVNNGIGEAVRVPILVARGRREGPTLGLTAAVHGNELNGIRLIQRFFEQIDLKELTGNIVGVLVVNVPGVLEGTRGYVDGRDLNRIAPGKPDGTPSEVYIHRVIDRIIKELDFLIDLHTAGTGFINPHYVRADMNDSATARMARLQNPEIILHNQPDDSTLRGAAESLGKTAICVELRDPYVFQGEVIDDGLIGIQNVLFDFKMLPGEIVCPVENTLLIHSSQWLYSDEGGVLTCPLELGDTVEHGQTIAEVRTIFGELTKSLTAPKKGVVIAKTVSPIAPTGSRIMHLGFDAEEVPCIV